MRRSGKRVTRRAVPVAVPHSSQDTFRDDLHRAFAESRTLADDAPDLFRKVSKQLAIRKANEQLACAAAGEDKPPIITEIEERTALADLLVKSLGPKLWEAAVDFQTQRDDLSEQQQEKAVEQSRMAQARRADTIAHQARKLQALLLKSAQLAREARASGWLRRPTTPRPDDDLADYGVAIAPVHDSPFIGSISEMIEHRLGWTAGVEARGTLTQVILDAETWSAAAHKKAKRDRGPRPNWARRDLSRWVAIGLELVGVWPNSGKTKTYGRVLAVVQRAAGYPQRDIERDMLYALSDPSLTKYLKSRRKITT